MNKLLKNNLDDIDDIDDNIIKDISKNSLKTSHSRC